MRKKSKILSWMPFFFVVVLVIAVFFYERTKINKRIKNAKYTFGMVTNINESAKGAKYVHYKFLVKSVEYLGSVNLDFCEKCGHKCCYSGAQVKVRYDSTNPHNSDLINE